MTKPRSATTARVFELLQRESRLTISEMAARLGVSRRRIDAVVWKIGLQREDDPERKNGVRWSLPAEWTPPDPAVFKDAPTKVRDQLLLGPATIRDLAKATSLAYRTVSRILIEGGYESSRTDTRSSRKTWRISGTPAPAPSLAAAPAPAKRSRKRPPPKRYVDDTGRAELERRIESHVAKLPMTSDTLAERLRWDQEQVDEVLWSLCSRGPLCRRYTEDPATESRVVVYAPRG